MRYLILLPILIPLASLPVLFSLLMQDFHPTLATQPASNTSMVVNTLEDELNPDGDCSLREAVTAANTNAPVDACPAGEAFITDTITFNMAGVISVTVPLSVTSGGPLVVDGGEAITTSGGGATRVWYGTAGSDLTLQNIAVEDGFTFYDGAGLYNNGSLTLISTTFSTNTTYYYGNGGGIYNNGTVTILNSTFSGNSATGNTAGGGVYNNGDMVVIDSTFSDNLATEHGGGMVNAGTLSILHSTFINNRSQVICTVDISCDFDGTSHGGGIQNSGNLDIMDSTFTNNWSTVNCDPMYCYYSIFSYGGGIDNTGSLTITHSTFKGNSVPVYASEYGQYAGYGGGIDNGGNLTIINSTFANNNAFVSTYCDSHVGCWGAYYAGGGGIRNAGRLRIVNSTITGNSTSAMNSNDGGGLDSWGEAEVANTIIANNDSGGDCAGILTDGGHNLDSDGTCSLYTSHDSHPNTNPRLGPLQDNGGPTWTQALGPDSPAIDAGGYAECAGSDQRGLYRPIDGDEDGIRVCDIGAFEYGAVDLWGINLIPPYPSRSGRPGTTFPYILNLFNQTAITDTYSIELGPHTWPATLSTGMLGPLPPQSSQAFTLTVTIPPEADWLQADTVILTATSVTSPPEYTAAIQVTTQAARPFYLPFILKK